VYQNDAGETTMTENGFDDWFYEMEGFGLRSERCASDFDAQNWNTMVEWLRTAYQMGYEKGQEA